MQTKPPDFCRYSNSLRDTLREKYRMRMGECFYTFAMSTIRSQIASCGCYGQTLNYEGAHAEDISRYARDAGSEKVPMMKYQITLRECSRSTLFSFRFHWCSRVSWAVGRFSFIDPVDFLRLLYGAAHSDNSWYFRWTSFRIASPCQSLLAL